MHSVTSKAMGVAVFVLAAIFCGTSAEAWARDIAWPENWRAQGRALDEKNITTFLSDVRPELESGDPARESRAAAGLYALFDMCRSEKKYFPALGEVVAIASARQERPTEAGGHHYRRILFNAAWSWDLLNAISEADRVSIVKQLTDAIHRDRSFDYAFYMGLVWSLSPPERLKAVNALGEKITDTTAVMLKGLTIKTLVPMEILDKVRQHQIDDQTKIGLPVRRLGHYVMTLNETNTEQKELLIDALVLALDTRYPDDLGAAYERARRFYEFYGRVDPRVEHLLNRNLDSIVRRDADLMLHWAWTLTLAQKEKEALTMDDWKFRARRALDLDPFMSRSSRNVRFPWLKMISMLAGDTGFSIQERVRAVARLQAVLESDERYAQSILENLQDLHKRGALPAPLPDTLVKRFQE